MYDKSFEVLEDFSLACYYNYLSYSCYSYRAFYAYCSSWAAMMSQIVGSAFGFVGHTLSLCSFFASLSFGDDSLSFGMTPLLLLNGWGVMFGLAVSEVSLLGDKF